MGIRKKGRRKLLVDGRLFVWWVGESEPDCWPGGEALTVASEDRRFYVQFHLRQRPERRFLVIQGREFGGLPDAGGCWVRVRCPEWQSGTGVRPSDVRRLIDWSVSPHEPRVRTNYRGEVISANVPIGAAVAE